MSEHLVLLVGGSHHGKCVSVPHGKRLAMHQVEEVEIPDDMPSGRVFMFFAENADIRVVREMYAPTDIQTGDGMPIYVAE